MATGGCYDFAVDPPVRVALTKYSFAGGIEWNHGFDCGSNALGRAVATSWDGYLVVGGSTNEYGAGGTDFLIASCTPSGHTCLETHDGPPYSDWSPAEEEIVLLSDDFDVDTTPWNHPVRVIPVERTPICAPRVLTVGDCLEEDEAFANIQAAIDASRDGDIIEVCPGIHSGAGNRDMNFAGRQIVLRAQDPTHANRCVIDCGGSLSHPHYAFRFHCGEGYASVIDEITIRDGHVTGNGGGILCTGGSPLIVNCTFDSCDAGDSGGGICCIDASPRIQQCRIIDCFAEWGGAMCCELSAVTLVGSEFTANDSYSGAGAICFNNCAGVTIRNCTFADNEGGGSGGALNLFYSAVVAENTIFWGDYPEEIYLVDSELSLACCDIDPELVNGWYVEWLEGNINADPLFCGPDWNPILPYLISGDSPCAPGANPDCGLIGAWSVGCNAPQDVPDLPIVEERLRFETIGPNPFSGTTSVCFRIPSARGAGDVTLEICDITGRIVRRLLDGRCGDGPRTVSWDGTNRAGQPVATGIYLCRLRAGDQSVVKRLSLIR